MTRRAFSGGQVIQNLANETAKGLAVAAATGSRFIDFNKASTAYVNAIGPTVSAVHNIFFDSPIAVSAHQKNCRPI